MLVDQAENRGGGPRMPTSSKAIHVYMPIIGARFPIAFIALRFCPDTNTAAELALEDCRGLELLFP
jgi:predicted ATPase